MPKPLSEPSMSVHDDWPSSRIFHLIGGARAFNLEGPAIDFQPPMVSGKICKIHVPRYPDAYGALQSLGLQILGVDCYTNSLELKGMAPPDWRIFCRGWPSTTLAQTWSMIAHGGFEQKNAAVLDVATRLSQQVRTCNWQLRQVSQAYEQQLLSRAKQKEVETGSRFVDGFTGLAYIAVQSYLVDACTLRDYLAEFLARVVWATHLSEPERKINTMSRLRDVFKVIPRPNRLVDTVVAATTPGGWLHRLSAYRNLVVHTAPLSMAGGHWFATIEHRPLPEGQLMPIMRLPLPTDPHAIKAMHTSADQFTDFNERVHAFNRAVKGEVPWVDSLDYLWQTHGQLIELGGEIAKASPVAGKMMVFDDSNIIGEIRQKFV